MPEANSFKHSQNYTKLYLLVYWIAMDYHKSAKSKTTIQYSVQND